MEIRKKEIVEQAIADIKQGKIVILFDNVDRENEGDFVQSAQMVNTQSVNFMITEGKGLLCCPLSSEIAQSLSLDMQVNNNTSLHHTAFTVSVDAVAGTTTGVSARDRAITINTLADARTVPQDLARPGHIFPIVAHKEGVQSRAGHTEASIELVRQAGHRPVAAICEILNKDGFAASMAQLEHIAKEHGLVLLHIEDLLSYIQHV